MVLYHNKNTARLAGLPARESDLDQQQTACKDRVSRHREETAILIPDIYLDFIPGIEVKERPCPEMGYTWTRIILGICQVLGKECKEYVWF